MWHFLANRTRLTKLSLPCETELNLYSFKNISGTIDKKYLSASYDNPIFLEIYTISHVL